MLLIKKICKFFTPRQVPRVLDHITDVGASQFEGTDSTYRIRQQYQNVNVQNPCIIPAGHSPLHVAFAGTTCLAPKARGNANYILKEIFNITQKKRLPIALNSAPRNKKIIQEDGKEDSIFWIQVKGNYADYVIYGLQVVAFVKVFHKIKSIKRIHSISNIIEDTSMGSQFRSAEHLPIIHVLAAMNELEENANIEDINIEDIEDLYPHGDSAIIAPSDEYKNGRIIVQKKTAQKILEKQSLTIPEISDIALKSCSSLTTVVSGEISIWPSSNHFPDSNLVVLNVGTRWAEGKTFLTYDEIINFSNGMKSKIGHVVQLEL